MAPAAGHGLEALQRFARPRADSQPRCRLCRHPIDPDDERHAHLVDLDERTILCACETCRRLLAQPGAGGARYRGIPDRTLAGAIFRLPDARWAALGIPVRLAFIFFNSTLGRRFALYPSPAGAAESELPEEAWRALLAAGAPAAEVEPDVEALLVHARPGDGGGGPGRDVETFVVPIDACYRLVGRVRRHWSGFHGGDAAWREIDQFFIDLRARARPAAAARAAEAAG